MKKLFYYEIEYLTYQDEDGDTHQGSAPVDFTIHEQELEDDETKEDFNMPLFETEDEATQAAYRGIEKMGGFADWAVVIKQEAVTRQGYVQHLSNGKQPYTDMHTVTAWFQTEEEALEYLKEWQNEESEEN